METCLHTRAIDGTASWMASGMEYLSATATYRRILPPLFFSSCLARRPQQRSGAKFMLTHTCMQFPGWFQLAIPSSPGEYVERGTRSVTTPTACQSARQLTQQVGVLVNGSGWVDGHRVQKNGFPSSGHSRGKLQAGPEMGQVTSQDDEQQLRGREISRPSGLLTHAQGELSSSAAMTGKRRQL